MKKPKKLLRKLLRKYQDELIEKPFSTQISRVEESIDIILSMLSEGKRR